MAYSSKASYASDLTFASGVLPASSFSREGRPVAALDPDKALSRIAYNLFIALIIMDLISIPNRIPVIGYARPSLLLVGAITALIILSQNRQHNVIRSHTSRLLFVLVGYVLLAIPFAEWPGTALGQGVSGFASAVVFFFFPLYLVDSYRRLRRLVLVFVLCQVFRVLEPLFLHVTTGYWGSQAHMVDGEFMDRLAGAPNDIIGPNGLAFVIMTLLPFLHYLFGGSHRAGFRVVYALLLPLLLYTLLLTGSRSGIVGLVVVYLFIIVRSKRRGPLLIAAFVAATIMVSAMDENSRDRYMSLVSHNAKNSATSEGRISAVGRDFEVGMRRPLFGHGIGTSREALANFANCDQLSHDLYTEVFIELGAVGVIIFLAVLISIVRNVLDVRPAVRRIWILAKSRGVSSYSLQLRLAYYHGCGEAVFVLSMMCMVFSIASYGLSELYWYLTAGISVSLLRLVRLDSAYIVAITKA